MQLLKDYKNKFPYVFDCLDKYLSYYKSSKFFKIYEIFSEIDQIEAKLTEIVMWINSSPLHKISFASSQSDYLPTESVNKIREVSAKKTEDLESKKKLFSTKLYVNPNYIFTENNPWTPMFLVEAPETFELGDRVININSTDRKYVPFGIKGTVTAIAENYVEVIFDQCFFGATTLNGRVDGKNGITMNPIGLINLTK